MNTSKSIAAVLLFLCVPVSCWGKSWVRREGVFVLTIHNEVPKLEKPSKTITQSLSLIAEDNSSESITVKELARYLAEEGFTVSDFWFYLQELIHLNAKKLQYDAPIPNEKQAIVEGTILTIPQYSPVSSCRLPAADLRNWFVAVLKGRKYKVAPWYALAVRNHENPRRDSYAYGVKCVKGTNLWTQAEWGVKLLKRYTPNALQPSQRDMYRCALVYVGQGPTAARHWSCCVYGFSRKLRGL